MVAVTKWLLLHNLSWVRGNPCKRGNCSETLEPQGSQMLSTFAFQFSIFFFFFFIEKLKLKLWNHKGARCFLHLPFNFQFFSSSFLLKNWNWNFGTTREPDAFYICLLLKPETNPPPTFWQKLTPPTKFYTWPLIVFLASILENISQASFKRSCRVL